MGAGVTDSKIPSKRFILAFMQGTSRKSLGLVVLLVVGLAAAALVVLVGTLADASLRERWRAERQGELGGLRATLEGEINGAANLTAGLIAEVVLNRGLDPEHFERHAAELMRGNTLLRNITLAPGNVIAMVYPLAGNEAALGLDLLNHPTQGAATRLMLASGRPVLAGPVTLAQGGQALIHRVPIYLNGDDNGMRGRYWGLMSTPIDFDRLIVAVGLGDPALPYRVALRGIDGQGDRGPVFWGDASVFEAPDAFLLDVHVLEGSWRMAALPLGEPPSHAWLLLGSRALALLLALMTISVVAHLLRVGRRLAESEQLHRELAEQMQDVLFQTDASQRVNYLNPAWTQLSGRPVSACLGLPWSELLHPDDRQRARGRCTEFIAARGGEYDEAFRVLDAAGKVREVVVRAGLHRNARAEVVGTVGLIIDVTERRQMETRLAVASSLFERSGEAIVVFDADGVVQAVNPAFSRITGFRAAAVVGTVFDPFAAQTGEPTLATLWRAMRDGDAWQGEAEARRASGESYPVALSATAVRDADGHLLQCLLILADISERKEKERAVEYLALHDSLTGLANRVQLGSRFEQGAAQARRAGHGMALLYFDLDGFKPLNDHHGHEAGDRMLCHVALRLRDAVRDSDVVARVGGDEFAILLSRVDTPEGARTVAAKVVEALNAPMRHGGGELRIGASIGIALFPAHGTTLDELMRVADRAMYQVKARGRGGWWVAELP